MVGRTYLKTALSISIFFVAVGWAGASAETTYLDTADEPNAYPIGLTRIAAPLPQLL